MLIDERQAELWHNEIVTLKERLADMTKDRDLAVSAIAGARAEGMHCANEWRLKCDTLQKAHAPLPDPRPTNLAELAVQVAKELRKRGIWATTSTFSPSCVCLPRSLRGGRVTWHDVPLHDSDFDNIGPIGCADVIQALEAKRAQKWAGDE